MVIGSACGFVFPALSTLVDFRGATHGCRHPSRASEVESHESLVALDSTCQAVEARWGMEVDLHDPMATDGGKALTSNRMEAKPMAGEPCRFCGRERVPLVKTRCGEQWICCDTAFMSLRGGG